MASTDTLATVTPFDTTDAAAVAVTLTGDATGTVDTDVSGNITALNITSPGSGYEVGDELTILEDGGVGAGTANVASIA